jgi:TIGR03009 family protein
MRLHGLVLTALLLAGGFAAAQNPPAQPTQPAQPAQGDQRLDEYLKRWESEMQKVQTLAAQLNRIEKDTTFNTTQKYTGYAQYLKTGTGQSAQNLAMLEMKQDGKQEMHEKWICTGAYLYHMNPAQKEIKAYDLPKKPGGQVADDSFLSFLFGMKAAEARRRYDLKLDREDQYYIYVNITPRFPQDKADFQRARIVLNKDSYLPRQLWFEAPNGSETTWDIPAIRSGVQVNRVDFDSPKTPQGWKLTHVPANAESAPTIRSGQ